MATATKQRPLRTGDRVVAVDELPGVPEGTAGTISLVNGLTWTRYFIRWDNGLWVGSVSHTKVTAEKDWPDFQVRREAERRRAAEAAAAPPAEAAPAAAGDAAADPAASKIPAHLLERAKKAREKAQAKAADG